MCTTRTLDPAESGRPGRERARRIGGTGTPVVCEFAAAELSGRLGVSTISAGMLMADGLDMVHRLPQLWARVEAGRVRVYLARLVAAADPDATAERERKAAEQQLARPTRGEEGDHGLRGFYIRAPFATIADLRRGPGLDRRHPGRSG